MIRLNYNQGGSVIFSFAVALTVGVLLAVSVFVFPEAWMEDPTFRAKCEIGLIMGCGGSIGTLELLLLTSVTTALIVITGVILACYVRELQYRREAISRHRT